MPQKYLFLLAITALFLVTPSFEVFAARECRGFSRLQISSPGGWYSGAAVAAIESALDPEIRDAIVRLAERAASLGRAGAESERAELRPMLLGGLGGRRQDNVSDYLRANPALIAPYDTLEEYLSARTLAMSVLSRALLDSREQQVNYLTVHNHIIAGARLRFNRDRGTLTVVHPSNKAAGVIFQDVRLRLQQLQITGSRHSFATAVQGWFNSMPYYTDPAQTPAESDLASFALIYKKVFHTELNVAKNFSTNAVGRSVDEIKKLLGIADE